MKISILHRESCGWRRWNTVPAFRSRRSYIGGKTNVCVHGWRYAWSEKLDSKIVVIIVGVGVRCGRRRRSRVKTKRTKKKLVNVGDYRAFVRFFPLARTTQLMTITRTLSHCGRWCPTVFQGRKTVSTVNAWRPTEFFRDSIRDAAPYLYSERGDGQGRGILFAKFSFGT